MKEIHKASFITFLVSSTFYMAVSLYLLGYHRLLHPDELEEKSYKYKKYLFVITLGAILGAMYYFARHNRYCEPLSK